MSNHGNTDIFMKQTEKKGSVHRILTIGQTGAGKSSVVNPLAQGQVATVSDAAKGCTFEFQSYQVTYGG